jgi:hypothetical protein
MADRRQRLRRACTALEVATLCLVATVVSAQTVDSRTVRHAKEQPVLFEHNRGQADSRVRYISRARDYTVALTDDEALLLVRKQKPSPHRGHPQASDLALVRMRLAGASSKPRITASEPLPGNVYFSDPAPGPLTRIDTFARVEYAGVYPGIDLVYYGDDHQLEFDFVVAPFADPNHIALTLDGAEGLTLTDAGDLRMSVGGSEVRLEKPLVYQERDGSRIEIPGAYVLPTGDTPTVRFRVGSYDRSRPLVIDPAWMTVFGSTNEDWMSGFAVDSAGHPRLLGTTFDPATFPYTQLESGVLPPANCFLTKLDGATGLTTYTILFANSERCEALALAPNDVAHFAGFVYPNGFHNNQGTTVTAVDDSSGVPVISRIGVSNYDSSAPGEGVAALAVNSLGHVFLLGPCRMVGPGDPPLQLSGYNETPDPAQPFVAEGCTNPPPASSEKYQPILTVVDSSGTFLYGSFLSPGEFVSEYGLAADDADRAYIVGAFSTAVSPTADAYRTVCPAAATRGFDLCGYLMVLDTTTTGPASLAYASYLWNTENVGTMAVRLGPGGEVYVASEGRVFDDFPSNRPTNPSAWPYSLYPALRDGIQLARFNRDASGLPSQFDFATVFDPSRGVTALNGYTVRESLADLRLFPSGAPAVASVAYTSSLAPLGIVTTFDPGGERVGEVWTQNLGTRTPVGFGVGTGSGGSLFLAGQIDRNGAPDSDVFVERIDAVDPGANRPPTVFILEAFSSQGNPLTIYADSPTAGALLQLNAIANDPEGDALTYSWSGPFADNPVTTNTFISARVALGLRQTVTVTVDDGHGNVVSLSQVFDVVGTPFVGTTATPVDSNMHGLVYNYAPVTITATAIGSGGGNAYLRTRLDQNPPIPAHLQAGSPPIYFDLSADAVLLAPFSVCIDTRGMSLANPGNIRLYHNQQSGQLSFWTDVTSPGYPQGELVCGQSNSLGTFAIFYPQVPSTAGQTIAGNGVLAGSIDGVGGSPVDDYRDGPATATALGYLFGGAYDRANNRLFVAAGADILRVNPNDNTIARVAGNGGVMLGSIDGPGGDPRDDLVEGGDAFNTYVGFPAEMAVAPNGDVVFFDRNTCLVRRVDAQGHLWAVAGNGTCGFSGDGFSAGLASLSFGQMAYDAAGNLFLADGTNARVRRIDALTNVIDTVAGDGTFGIPAHGASARSTISLPMGIAIDSQGHLLIAGGMHLLRISTGAQDALVDGDADEVISVVGGCNTNCMLPFNGDGMPVSHPQVYLPGMGHLTVMQDGSVIFPDYFRIRRILPGADGIVTGAADEIISTIAGYYDWETASLVNNFNGDTFSTQSRFSWAQYVVDDAQGGILVVDGNNVRVRRFGLPPVGASLLTIDTPALPTAIEGAAYSATILAAGGTGTGYTWSIDAGALPAGLALAQMGTPGTIVSGTATEGGTFTFTVRVTDSDGNTATRAFSLVVDASLTIDTPTVPNAIEGAAYSATILAAGGTGTGYTWTVSAGALPAGLALAPTGTPGTTMSGTPTEDGTFNFTVRVTDSGGTSATRAFTLTVAASVVQISVTETIVVSDAVGLLPSAMIGIAEQIVVNDAPMVLPSAMIGVSEQIVVTDGPGVLPSAMVGVSEQITVSDSPQVAPQALPPTLVLVPVFSTLDIGDQRTIAARISDGSDEATRVVVTAQAAAAVRLQFLDPGAANAPLSVSVTPGNPLGGSDVTVSLATNATGARSSTAAQVVAALNASPASSAVLTAQTWPGNAGAGIVPTGALAPLTPVRFTIEGSSTLTESCLATIPGICSISYTRAAAGVDQVFAYVDVNGNDTLQPDEPTAGALTQWIDNVAPVLTVPGPIVAEAQTPNGAVVTFAASATDSSPVDVACSPASGSVFPFNGASPTTTVVTCTAADAGGNVVSDSFSVTVQDTTAPQVITAQLVIAATEATGARGNVPQAPHSSLLQQIPLLAGTFDAGDPSPARVPVQWVACGNPAQVLGPITNSTLYPVGPNCFSYAFRDASGNVGTGVGTITVSPPIGGHINVPNAPVTATDSNNVPWPVTATFLGLDQPGLLTAVVPQQFIPPPPEGLIYVGPPLELLSTALTQAPAVVCMRSLSGDVAERLLVLEFFQWVDWTETANPATGEICGRPRPLGTFALVRRDLSGLTLSMAPASAVRPPGEPLRVEAVVEDSSPIEARVAIDSTLDVNVEFRNPMVPNSPLSLIIQSDASGAPENLIVSLATGPAGELRSTAANVANLMTSEASNRIGPGAVVATWWPETRGEGIVMPRPLLRLARLVIVSDSFGPLASCYISTPGFCSHEYTRHQPATEFVSATLDLNHNGVTDGGELSAATFVTWDAPPLLYVSANITVPADAPAGSAVQYGVFAEDGVGGAHLPVACSRASGSIFPIGTTTVTCTTEDPAGNVVSRSFTITVVVGTPSIPFQITGKGRDASGAYVIRVMIENVGTGHAKNLNINSLAFKTLTGTGVVTYDATRSGPLPMALGNLDAGPHGGAITLFSIYLNVPATVRRFSISEAGTFVNVLGATGTFSATQAIIP